MYKISKLLAREIIDSRATPTVEVDLTLVDGSFGRASVPSGASTGTHEVLELRDADAQRYLGKGVLKAVNNVKTTIFNALNNKEFNSQRELDQFLIDLDGSELKSNLGANAILGVSLAFAKAVATSKGLPLFKYIAEIYNNQNTKLPTPMFNIMNGGRHANWSTDIQEFMIVMPKFDYKDQLRAACEIFLTLEKSLKEQGLSINVGNEGGFAPGFKNNEDALNQIQLAVEKAGYKVGEDVFFALDVAASEFYNAENGNYKLKTEGKELAKEEWLLKLESWVNTYPFFSIEDPFAEDDWGMWEKFTAKFADKIQIVGDDLLVTNVKRIEKAIPQKTCNALLVKVNQIGTLTETLSAMKMSQSAGWNNIVSHRSGETEDTTISHIAVGTGCGQIKTGAPSRSERTAKFNELLRISELI